MNQLSAGGRTMPTNNNQKGLSAAARLAKLPVVQSACSTLSLLYSGTKCNHPNVKSVCELLENRVTALGTVALDRVSPVMGKLEPQISVANDVACKGLDWLEMTFPVLHEPTEQVVATAKTKIHEIQDAVGIAANGTMGCVQHTVSWVIERMQQMDDRTNQSLVKRAISVASVGLDSALNVSEALVEQVLPPPEVDKEEDTGAQAVGFEVATVRSYPVRVVSLGAKLCRRSCHMVWARMQSVQVMAILSRPSSLAPDFQTTCLTLVWSIQGLPQYLQHQVVSALFFISQMYTLTGPQSEQNHSSQVQSPLTTSARSSNKDVAEIQPQGGPICRLRPTKMSVFDNGCTVKGCGRR